MDTQFFLEKNEVDTFLERKKCDSCQGELIATGVTLTSYPPQYQHVCNRCEKKVVLESIYPRISYLESGNHARS